jgi:hypothetical protein
MNASEPFAAIDRLAAKRRRRSPLPPIGGCFVDSGAVRPPE